MRRFLLYKIYFVAASVLFAAIGSMLLSRRTQAISNEIYFASDTTTQIRIQMMHQIFLPLVQTTAWQDSPYDPDVHTGEATFYAATGAGNCSFEATPDDLMIAAMNHTDYANARLCGAYVEVTGPQGIVTVRIVDRCPGCAPGDIDLSREAFALIANPADGRVPIEWRVVSPDMSGPLVYHFKEGSNQFWTAVQIRNHRNPVHSFEYRADDGQFKPVPREQYNYFVEASGLGPGPYTFRVTDIYGNMLTDSGIAFVEDGEVSGAAQFPAP
jgi:expansin (peptidoglycan-binding protein)